MGNKFLKFLIRNYSFETVTSLTYAVAKMIMKSYDQKKSRQYSANFHLKELNLLTKSARIKLYKTFIWRNHGYLKKIAMVFKEVVSMLAYLRME